MRGILRKATADDAKAMAALDRLCFSIPWSKETFDHELGENALAFYLVAEVRGKLIGYAGLWTILNEGHITNVAVHPDHRRKGLGEILVFRLIEAAEEAGLEKFTLEVRAGNRDAIALYKKLGFQEDGCRKGYYGDNGEDALVMWRY